MTAIFDTHAHYDDDAFNDDREQLLAALPGQGIARVVDVGASLASCRKVLELMEQYDYIYGAIGVHPSETAELTEESYSWLKEQCRTGIVQGKERKGQCRDHHIDHSIMKYVRFNFTEKQGNDAITEHHDQNRNTDGNAYGGHDQLFCRFAGVLFFPGSEELGGHHGSAGSQCRQHTDDQIIKHVDQGYAGDRRFARRRDHDRIRHTHGNSQRLFK